MNISKKQLIIIASVLALVLILAIGITVWALFFRDSGTPPITPDYPPQGTEQNQKPLEGDESEKIESKVREAMDRDIHLSCHAIGQAAIDQITDIYSSLAEKLPGKGAMMRIDHFEFPSRNAVEKVKEMPIALTVQPGFSWIDKRYLKSYEQYLPEETINAQIPLRELSEAGVCICGSSDSPVQSVNPYDQMLGMTEFYIPEQSLSPYEAMKTYTLNAAKMLGEEEETGSLEIGKSADFFATGTDIFRCRGAQIASVKADFMVVRGRRFRQKKGNTAELAWVMLGRKKKI